MARPTEPKSVRVVEFQNVTDLKKNKKGIREGKLSRTCFSMNADVKSVEKGVAIHPICQKGIEESFLNTLHKR